jgi:O-phosphoseryl-tRNA synthetase
MDEEIDVGYGEEITKALLEPLGFKDFRFVKKKVTSKYYAPGMEYEGFIYSSSTKKWIEVVDYGMYSPIALARYDLEYPVLNLGIGVERLAMVMYGEEDIRRLVYPQFYKELTLSDLEIARTISFELEPETDEGKMIAEQIILEALKHADAPSPCEFLVYEGKVLGKKVSVYIYEEEEDSTLLGPAAENQIYVYEGNILGVPTKGLDNVPIIKEARQKGVPTGIRYIDGVARFVAARVEEAVKSGKKRFNLRIRMARRLKDVNLSVGSAARRFITSRKKKIDILGPIFLGIRAEISD